MQSCWQDCIQVWDHSIFWSQRSINSVNKTLKQEQGEPKQQFTEKNWFGQCCKSVPQLKNCGHLVLGDKLDYRALLLACHLKDCVLDSK